MTLSLGVLLSGGGSNLQSIIDHLQKGALDAVIRLVLSDELGAEGLKRAKKQGIRTEVVDHRGYVLRTDHDRVLLQILEEVGVEVVCLAGYMRLIGEAFVQSYPNRILNIHPSLLPSFPGLDAQQQAADAGERLARRILAIEHRIYPQALEWLAKDRLRVEEGKVHLLPDPECQASGNRLESALVNPPLENGF